MSIPLLKKSSILPIFLVFSVVAVTVPFRASAQTAYTGELQLPNTQVVPDYRQANPYMSKGGRFNSFWGAGGDPSPVTISNFNGSYSGWPATFTPLENNNFISSQTQKTFAASINDDVLTSADHLTDCSGDTITINPADNSIILTGIAASIISSSDGMLYKPSFLSYLGLDPLALAQAPQGYFFCQPTVSPTDQNTTSTLTNGGLSVTQTYDLIPGPSLGDNGTIVSVESLPTNASNVLVTVTENPMQEFYGVQFTRQGDVAEVIPGRDLTPWYGDANFYKDGKNYLISWITDWTGQVLTAPPTLSGSDGMLYKPSFLSYLGLSPVASAQMAGYDAGYQLAAAPQILSLGVIHNPPTVATSTRPRNSDIISVTQPRCSISGGSGFTSSWSLVSCATYGLSADGRTGVAHYSDYQTGGGDFQAMVGVAITGLGMLAGFGAFGPIAGTSIIGGFTVDLGAEAISLATGQIGNQLLSSASIGTAAAAAAVVATTLQTVVSSPTPFGTVENPISSQGIGTWTWNPSTAPIPTLLVVSVPTISVISPTTGQTVVQGGTLNISWNSQNSPAGSAVVLSLVNAAGTNLGIVARNQAVNGTTDWNLPGIGATVSCADCGGIQETVPVGTYKIVAKIYAPSNAWFGDTPQPASSTQPTYLASGDSNIFTVLNPAPSITSVSPNSASPGTGFTLAVNGTNFVPSSVVNFNGAAKTTSFVSVSQLTASIPASDATVAGSYPVTVINPTPGGGTSNPHTFTVTIPLPSCVFFATPSSIVPPQSSSLSWNCGNANSCSIDNGIGSVGVNGSSTVKPNRNTTYTLSCNGAGGGASFQTTVRVTNFNIQEVSP